MEVLFIAAQKQILRFFLSWEMFFDVALFLNLYIINFYELELKIAGLPAMELGDCESIVFPNSS
jgi:hypothetical protein